MIKQHDIHFRIVLLLVVLLSLLNPNVQGQDYKFKNIGGLSDNNVTAIFEDSQGYIWIGTRNGLNRYNGIKYDIFEPIKNDSTSIKHPYINYISETSNGDLWIAHGEGISRYNRSSHNFKNFSADANDPNSIANNYSSHLYCDANDLIWIANNGVDVLDAKTEKVIARHLEGENIGFIFEDSQNRKWMVGDKIFVMNQKGIIKQLMTDKSNLSVKSATEDEQGNIWLASWQEGLFKLTERNQDDFAIKQFVPEANQNSLHIVRILEIMSDQKGNLWIGMENGGLDILEINSETFTHLSPDPTNPLSLHSNSIWALTKDSNGRIWVGSFDKGIDLMDPYQKAFVKVNDSEGNLNSSAVNTFAEDSKGNIWIGADGYGLDYYNLEQNTFTHFEHEPKNPNSLPNNAVLKVAIDQYDNVLIGTWAGGLTYYDVSKKKFYKYLHDPNDLSTIGIDNVFSLSADPANPSGFYVGTWGAELDYFDTKTRTFIHLQHEDPNDSLTNITNIRSMKLDKDGNLWLGTGNGLFHLNVDHQSGKYTAKGYTNRPNDESSLSENAISCLQITQSGKIWVGTENRGLNLFLPSKGNFQIFDKEHGLPSNAIKSIEEDAEGNLWVSSALGISKITTEANGEQTTIKIRNFDKGDGLQSNFFNMSSSLKSSWGEMFFGGSDGFNRFVPADIKINPIIPEVTFTDFKVFNKSVIPSQKKNAILTEHISNTETIHLNYTHEIFSIDFIALNYTRPEKNNYAYMMEGMDDEWNYIDNQTTATFTTLAPGTYVFRVKASNNDGIWNEEGASVIIEITPPWWATWWFRLLALTLVITATYFLIQNKRKQTKLQKAELQSKLDEAVAEVQNRNAGLRAQNENLSSSITDTNFVIQEAVESGNFQARINTENKEGQWKDLSESINTLFDSVASPINTINEIARAMASGDLAKRMDENAKGEILSLTQNFNKALYNLNTLLHQITESASTIELSSMEMLNTSEEMTRNTEEIASAITQMSNGAQTQVTRVDESSTVVEGIRLASEEMASKSESINKVALEGAKSSEKGKVMVNNVSESMEEISDYSTRTNHSMKGLKERSVEIHRVLGVISNIANQTNLLALNAAIEAAQAGDAGRGFAVVADEIRKLAESSKSSTKEIEQLIDDVQNDTSMAAELMETMSKSVHKGVAASQQVSNVFEEIREASTKTLSFSEDILTATRDQALNINKVVTTIESVVVIAEQTAAGTEEVAASANELVSGMTNYTHKSHRLNDIAIVLKEAVGKFRLSEAEEKLED